MRRGKAEAGVATALAAFMAVCRFIPGFARLWTRNIALPFLTWLHGATASLPFPLLEPAAIVLLAFALWDLIKLRFRRFLRLALLVITGFALLWYPLCFDAPTPVTAAEPAALESFCLRTMEELTDLPPFPAPADILRDAPRSAGLPDARVKAVRWPEWMRGLGISGLFAPWTGEALVSPELPVGLLPFTAVHELMHLRGIADEGSANLAAWERCMAQGGIFAASARLWALGPPGGDRRRRAGAGAGRHAVFPAGADARPFPACPVPYLPAAFHGDRRRQHELRCPGGPAGRARLIFPPFCGIIRYGTTSLGGSM